MTTITCQKGDFSEISVLPTKNLTFIHTTEIPAVNVRGDYTPHN